MLNYDNFAITLGRAVDVFRRGPEAVPEQKVALRALAGLSRLAGVVLEVGVGELRVGGRLVPPGLPGISVLLAQLEGHDVAEIRIPQATSPASPGCCAACGSLGARRPAVDLQRRPRGRSNDVEVLLLRLGQPPPPPPPGGPARRDADVTTEQSRSTTLRTPAGFAAGGGRRIARSGGA
jgi:hypothetical protein